MKVHTSGPASVRGSRFEQEDAAALFASPRFAVAVIADGVSSSPDGGACAQIAARSACDHLAVFPAHRRDPAPFLHSTSDSVVQDLRAAVAAGLLDERSKSTLAAAVVLRGFCWTLTLGDSRVVLVRDGRVIESTTTHSAGAAHAGGAVASSAPRGLMRWVSSAGDGGDATVQCWRLLPGDAVVVTSDGVDDVLAPWRAARIIATASRDHGDPTDTLLAEIEAAGGAVDNATVAVLSIPAERTR